MNSPVLQIEISNIKNLQEMRSQQALFKVEVEMQHETLNSWVDVVQKREQSLSLTMVDGVVQAKLNE